FVPLPPLPPPFPYTTLFRSSCCRSPLRTQEASTSVGARSSLGASGGPAALFRRKSVSGPSTRKRHGFVRWWFGAQRASSSSSSRSEEHTSELQSLAYLVCRL